MANFDDLQREYDNKCDCCDDDCNRGYDNEDDFDEQDRQEDFLRGLSWIGDF